MVAWADTLVLSAGPVVAEINSGNLEDFYDFVSELRRTDNYYD